MFPERIRRVVERVDRLREEVDDHWQIPADEALVLAQLVRIGRCVSICEVGTSYGFSTLHLAAAASEHGGHVHTIDVNPRKTEAARGYLREAGLEGVVILHQGDARDVLRSIRPDHPFDFAFLDATKEQSEAYLDAILPLLAPRYLIVTDNTTTHAEELAPFVDRLRRIPSGASCHVAVGNGFELTVGGIG